MKGSKQTGFSIVEAVLSVAALGVISAAGLLVYQHDRTQLTGAASHPNPTSSQQTAATKPTPIGKTLDINEWGVHLTLDNTTASLYYYISPNLPDVAYISLRDIVAVAPNCGADKIALGAITRLTEAQQQSFTSDPSKGTPGTIHIGSSWYSVANSPSACTGGTAASNAALHSAAPNYNPGVLLNTLNTLAAD